MADTDICLYRYNLHKNVKIIQPWICKKKIAIFKKYLRALFSGLNCVTFGYFYLTIKSLLQLTAIK